MIEKVPKTVRARFPHLSALLVTGVWALLACPHIASPWIHGVDSVTRLFHIDQILVFRGGSPWLPGLQWILKLVYLFSDSPQAYKAVVFVFSAAGVFLTFRLLTELFSLPTAWWFSLYFVTSSYWRLVSTSIYLEPLLLAYCAGAAYAALRGRRILSALLFVAATFCREELLLGAPALLLVVYLLDGDLRRGLRFGTLFLPVIVFQVVVRLSHPDARLPTSVPSHIFHSVYLKLISEVCSSSVMLATTMLAAGSIVCVFTIREYPNKEMQRPLRAALGGLAVFFLILIFVSPFLFSYTSGSRMSMFLTFPICVFASVLLGRMHEKVPLAGWIGFAVAACFMDLNFVDDSPTPARDYLRTKPILVSLRGAPNSVNSKIFVCDLVELDQPGEHVHPVVWRSLLLYLRFGGFRVEFVHCRTDPDGGQDAVARPLLYFYRIRSSQTGATNAPTPSCPQRMILTNAAFGDVGLCIRTHPPAESSP